MEETRKYKQTELGLLPEDWEVVKLGEIFRFISNNTFSRDFLCEDGEIKNIHYGDVLIKYDSTLDVSQSDIPAINTEILPSYQPKCFAEDSLTEWTAKSTEVSTMRSTVTVLSREMDRFCFSVIHATTSLNR